jgi:hypothetical protein
MNTQILVENTDEVTRLKALKKEIERLVSDSYLKVTIENLGYKSVEELKKI